MIYKKDITMKPETFYSLLAEQNINLTDQQKFQFERYFELLVEWNQKINLTAITEKEEVYLKHFYDSIAPILQGLIENQEIKLLDIGAGAGFPSLPMKILYPQLDVTIIDSLNKRINFLQLLSEELDLEGVHFLPWTRRRLCPRQELSCPIRHCDSSCSCSHASSLRVNHSLP